MKAQIILYNQFNTEFLSEGVEKVFVVNNVGDPDTPTGKLQLNDYAKILSYAMGLEFAQECNDIGYQTRFLCVKNIQEAWRTVKKECTSCVLMEPSEPYMSHKRKEIQQKHTDTLTITPNQQFLLDHQTFRDEFDEPPVMETFYRWIRKKTGILMNDSKPVGGKRNYDKSNRGFDRDFSSAPVKKMQKTTGRKKAEEYYNVQKEQHYPTNREQALSQLHFFVEELFDRFGDLQDAMYEKDDFVHHSLLSVALNYGLLTPQEVIGVAEQADVPINNKEGFIRQILGRREYMYHYIMYYQDSIYDQNVLNHMVSLPQFFRSPEKSPLRMNCINHVLQKVKKYAYSHHIERLMIIGNFTLLCEINPHDVNKRFREMYADAFERVVTPNVLGMSQYADGGKLATKPYVSSANYINKMSDYCKNCEYNPKEKYGEDACPFNYLYRNFIQKNTETIKKARQSFILKHLEKIDSEAISKQAEEFINTHILDPKSSVESDK